MLALDAIKESIYQRVMLYQRIFKCQLNFYLKCKLLSSAYYGAPVTVQVLKCDPIGPMAFHREVNLIMNGNVSALNFIR